LAGNGDLGSFAISAVIGSLFCRVLKTSATDRCLV
jgi:hypothetical protein